MIGLGWATVYHTMIQNYDTACQKDSTTTRTKVQSKQMNDYFNMNK